MHMVAWRVYALTLLGRWEDALAMGERARQLWLESGRPSAGYALHGFMAAIDIARAHQDERLLDVFGTIHDEISAEFPENSQHRRWVGYGQGNLDAVADAVTRFLDGPAVQIQRLERGLSCLLDHDRLVSRTIADRALLIHPGEFPLLEAQANRLLGRIDRDPERLTRALAALEHSKAAPYAARVRAERALLTGDRAELEAAIAVLEQLGDKDQVCRFERLQVA
jgi:hypothetical protein